MTGRLPDDTELDALAAEVRSIPRLEDGQLAALLREARDAPDGAAASRLVEQSLAQVLDAVLARRPTELDLMDLYQEGSLAATVAVREFAARGGRPDALPPYVSKVVTTFLDDVVEAAVAQKVADELLVAQVELAEAAELTLRRRLERPPTTLELAGVLQWTPERVEVVMDALRVARDRHDVELVEYLDDDEET